LTGDREKAYERARMGRVLDLIFPLECLACGAPGAHACGSCLAAVPPAPKIFEDGASRVAAGFSYAQPLVRRLLRDAKYEGWTAALPPLETLARRALVKTSALFPAEAAVAAVPLHPSRLRARGFNQADALARAVAGATGRRLARAPLVRVRRTKPQTDADDRAGNVRGAFLCGRLAGALLGRPFLLVDDVRTSGSTMRECAAALQAAGAGPVHGFALAWGSGNEKDGAEAPPSGLFT